MFSKNSQKQANPQTKTRDRIVEMDLGSTVGGASLLAIFILFTLIGLWWWMGTVQTNLNDIVNIHMEKIQLVTQMRANARERTLNLQRMMILQDPFARDDEFMKFNAHGAYFARARIKLNTYELSSSEKTLIKEQGVITGAAVPIQNKIVELITLEEHLDGARRLLIDEANPLQDQVLNKLTKLHQLQENLTRIAATNAQEKFRSARIWMLILSSLASILGLNIAFLVVRRNNRATRDREANEAKSLFLANMSHELRTPLNAIIGYAEIIEEDSADAGLMTTQADCRKILNSSKHLLTVISQILDLSKIEANKMELSTEEFDLEKLIQDTVVTIEPLAEEHHNKIIVNYSENLGIMFSDQTKTRQILLNVLSNACKFTDNGTINIETQINHDKDIETVQIQIQDSGIGIAEEKLEAVFNPFVQEDESTTRRFGGTGLGLSISQHFCQLLGGEIDIQSQTGCGTKVTVLLPRTQNSTPFKIAV